MKTLWAVLVGVLLLALYTSSSAFTVTYTYDDTGALTGADYGNRAITYTYDGTGNILRIKAAATKFTLTASRSGAGSGAITSSPAGINCGTQCTGTFAAGATLTLTATPSTGSVFSGWQGACTGASPTCQVAMTSDKSASAAFAVKQYTVTASAPGGHGSVTPLTQKVNHGASASFTVTPDTGYNIASITDNDQPLPVDGPYVIANVTADHAIVVAFSTAAWLVVEKTGNGSGTVASAPKGINCGSTCSYGFRDGTKVTLSAKPAVNSTFTGWSGGGCSDTKTCVVTLKNSTTVTAGFQISRYTVAASIPKGHGSLAPVTQKVNYGAPASIAVTPDKGYVITKITDNGKAMPVTNPYVIANVIAEHTVAVTLDPGFTLSVMKTGSGRGTIVSSPGGIVCGSACAYDFKAGARVTLTAKPESDSLFAGWSGGGCSGTRTCVVTMTMAAEVTATFKSEPNIVVTPPSWTYGNVGVNKLKPAVFTIRNTGKKALTVATITLGGTEAGEFNKSADTCSEKTINPSGVCRFTVTFAPKSVGGKSASALIHSNDPDTPAYALPLTGNGVKKAAEGDGTEIEVIEPGT